LKVEREKKQITYKGKSVKITADFSTESLKARRAWSEVFWALNENKFSPRILYSAKLSIKIDRATKIFHNKQKPKQYMTTKPQLQKIPQGILHTEDESKETHERMGSTKLQTKKRKIIRE
jgi:vacuolar-type H+-ATPase catalytic subunit A/Vma1